MTASQEPDGEVPQGAEGEPPEDMEVEGLLAQDEADELAADEPFDVELPGVAEEQRPVQPAEEGDADGDDLHPDGHEHGLEEDLGMHPAEGGPSPRITQQRVGGAKTLELAPGDSPGAAWKALPYAHGG